MAKKILLADDSVTIQKVVELTFMDEDFEVEAVGSGNEAIDRLGASSPDLVIADVHMPGADGYAVCQAAKDHDSGLPVLLLVGTFEPFDEQKAVTVGANAHLKKPFDAQDLLRQVHDLTSSGRDAVAAEPTPAAFEAPDFELDLPGQSPSSPTVDPAEEQTRILPTQTVEPPPMPVTEHDTAAIPEGVFQTRVTPIQPPVSPPPGVPLETVAISTIADDLPPVPTVEAPVAVDGPVVDTPAVEAPAVESASQDDAPSETTPDEATPDEATPDEATAEIDPAAVMAAADDAANRKTERTSATSANGNGHGTLSDTDIDRLARRVVDLISAQTVREVAWEVVPDLAEVVIKERIRELESQLE